MARPHFSVLFLLFFASVVLHAQTPQDMPEYKAAWKTIDSLEKEGLPRSALEKVEALSQRAKEDAAHPQYVKTVIYRNKYLTQLEEEGFAKAIERIQAETEAADFPVQPVLHSLLAELYQSYLQRNQYRIQQRTETTGFLPDDITTWTVGQLTDAAGTNYLKSLADQRTAEVPIEQWAAITTNSEAVDHKLRPTLYDFLAHRALAHFMDEASFLNEPAYKFVLRDPTAFAPAADFVDLAFPSRDTASYTRKALLLFQDLLQLRRGADNLPALVDADLKRLAFVYQKSVAEQKDSLYLAALDRMQQAYGDTKEVTQILYKKAELFRQWGNSYSPNQDTTHRWKLSDAADLCQEAMKLYPKSYGAQRCKALLVQLQRTEAGLQAEAVNLPNEPLLMALQYRNMDQVHFRLVRLSAKDRLQYESQSYRDAFEVLKKAETLRNWSAQLPDEGDLQQHRIELPIAPLPLGNYALLFAENERFKSKGGSPQGVLYFAVSEMGYLFSQDQERILLAHRAEGQPLPGVEATFYRYQYNARQREREQVKLYTDKSDEQGFIAAPNQDNYASFAHLVRGADELIVRNVPTSYTSSYSNQQQDKRTLFFLDRSIYRPGQAVYFKVLTLAVDEDGVPTVLPNEPVDVTFNDANGEKVEVLSFKTNTYGTANGVFTAPAGGLLGRMHLKSSVGGSRHNFYVEEYKRPKFEVKIDPLAGSPQLGDTVTVQGVAEAYAGSSISDSDVSYRVVRQVRFPWWPWWRSIPNYGSSQEMAAGTATTDAEGRFVFEFVARPDESVPREQRPQFNYTIYVDVTDQNGETRSASRSVNLAYLSVKADMSLPDAVDRAEESFQVGLITQNLDGQPLPKQTELSVHRLQAPGRYQRERYWEVPDYQYLEEAAFAEQFPQYAYQRPPKPQFWAAGEEVLTATVNTGEQDSLLVDCQDWPVGYYRLRMTVEDDSGERVEVSKFVMVYDQAAEALPPNVLHWPRLSKPTPYQVGEALAAHLATGQEEAVSFLFELERRNALTGTTWESAGPWHTFRYEIQEQDRGGIYLHYTGMKHNRAFTEAVRVEVPWREKKIDISYQTFRDKLKPGQQETWSMVISGPDKDRVAAEMVATLYDASLDAFRAHDYQSRLYPRFYSRHGWRTAGFGANTARVSNFNMGINVPQRVYRQLNWFNWYQYGRGPQTYMRSNMAAPARGMEDQAVGFAMEADSMEESSPAAKAEEPMPSQYPASPGEEPPASEPTPVRRNLDETVFFYPELRTDEDGNVLIEFTMNEALTRWKFLAFAHTESLQYAVSEREVVTQKELMVQPNAPRFVRQGDRLQFPAKVSNLTENELSGTAKLELFDAVTMEPVDEQLGNDKPTQPFSVQGGQSTGLYWEVAIPDNRAMAIVHRVTVQAGDFADGEEAPLPVLTNRKLVTETLPLPVRGGEKAAFTFEAMDKARQSKTLQHHRFTLEFTSNPAWYAVKALPYLMEYPHNCTEQIFSRYYANSLATTIANQQPELKRVFEQWRNTEALVSELAKNEELKNILLQQTPWVVEAQNEEAQRKRIGLLFDLNRMAQEQRTAIRQLREQQSDGGGFAWFPGGYDSWYITQYILEGFSRLRDLGVSDEADARYIMRRAAKFVDLELADYYSRLSEEQKEAGVLPSLAIHYLYTRSLTQDMAVEEEAQPAFDYFLEEARDQWLKQNLYEQGMLAVVFQRQEEMGMANKIVNSLRERALYDEEQGMYWKYNTGFYWYQLPIETHAMMIEVFARVAEDAEAVEQLKIWLLKNKQTNHWKTTKATANAVYALLRYGDNWLEQTELAAVRFPDLPKATYAAPLAEAQGAAEAGTGYFKTSWSAEAVEQGFSNIEVQNPNNSIAWGAAYWQYFEHLDKIQAFEDTPLTLNKQLFQEVMGDNGSVLQLVTPKTKLQPGDKLVSRIELRVDRDMEYVHLRDMRASGLEPTNVLSRYKYQDGLGYYESTRDASTDFFFDRLPKGTYVFEYPVRVVHRGSFANGIAEIQCMYAPEFSSHSNGVEIEVGEK